MKQRYIGRCRTCAGQVWGPREEPLQALGFREGDECMSCGAVVQIVMVSAIPSAPGVAGMVEMAGLARRRA